MHHPTNHLRGRGGHGSRLARSSRGMLGVVVQPPDCAELPFPGCPVTRAVATFFSKTVSALRPPFPGLLLSVDSFPSVSTERRWQQRPRPSAHRPEGHFRRRFTSWLGGWSRAGARAGEGRRVSLRRALPGSAGARAGAERGPGSRCSAASSLRRRPARRP